MGSLKHYQQTSYFRTLKSVNLVLWMIGKYWSYMDLDVDIFHFAISLNYTNQYYQLIILTFLIRKVIKCWDAVNPIMVGVFSIIWILFWKLDVYHWYHSFVFFFLEVMVSRYSFYFIQEKVCQVPVIDKYFFVVVFWCPSRDMNPGFFKLKENN